MSITGNISLPRHGLSSTADASDSKAERLLMRFFPRIKPIVGDLKLTRKNVYVLPSRAGLLFSFALLAMLICSINYGLSLGYALSFLVFGIGVVGLMHTFRNLSALTLRPGRSEPVFAGQMADVSLMLLNRSGLDRFAVRVDAAAMVQTEILDVSAQSELLVHIAVPAHKRGWMQVPKLVLSTRFPLGIWRAWAYWQPAQHVLVYPEPETPPPPLPVSTTNTGDGQGGGGLEEDLAAIRPFQQGDSPRRIAWTAIARSGSDELLTKQFEGGATGELMLDFARIGATMNTEARLSRLTRWVLEAESLGTRYALSIPGTSLDANNGPAHQMQCLKALALYGITNTGSMQ